MIIHLHVIISTNKVIRRKLQECKPGCSIISPNEIDQYNNIIHNINLIKSSAKLNSSESHLLIVLRKKKQLPVYGPYTVEWERYAVIIYRPVHRIEVNKLSHLFYQCFVHFAKGISYNTVKVQHIHIL